MMATMYNTDFKKKKHVKTKIQRLTTSWNKYQNAHNLQRKTKHTKIHSIA